jgi:hypothetical protein
MINDDPFHTFALDAFGNRVRIGLTFAETVEFDALNAEESTDSVGGPLPWHSQDEAIPRREDRWFELYRKHEAARYAVIRSKRPHMVLSPVFAAQ